jgi:hypothetical protein
MYLFDKIQIVGTKHNWTKMHGIHGIKISILFKLHAGISWLVNNLLLSHDKLYQCSELADS